MAGDLVASEEKPPVRVDLGVRAEAKLDVKATVPDSSMGRLVDAITDVLRPFSEARGFRADQIRLQREDVAIMIARKAKQRLAIEGEAVQPVPNKILVPLIESGSNEGIDDARMIDMWANLLASAASSDNVEPRFVGILRELHGRQAQAFERLVLNKNESVENLSRALEEVIFDLEPANIRQTIKGLFINKSEAPEIDDIYDVLTPVIDRPGSIAIDIIIEFGDDMWSFTQDQMQPDHVNLESNLEILASLGLCRNVFEHYTSPFDHDISIIYYKLTDMGLRFFSCCKGFR